MKLARVYLNIIDADRSVTNYHRGASAVPFEKCDEPEISSRLRFPLLLSEVMGYADSTGIAAMNTRLSENREQGNVPVRHIVAPGAMGE